MEHHTFLKIPKSNKFNKNRHQSILNKLKTLLHTLMQSYFIIQFITRFKMKKTNYASHYIMLSCLCLKCHRRLNLCDLLEMVIEDHTTLGLLQN